MDSPKDNKRKRDEDDKDNSKKNKIDDEKDKQMMLDFYDISKNSNKLLDDYYNSSYSEDDIINKNDWKYVEIKKEIHDINDLIELGQMYNPNDKIRYNIDLEKLNKLLGPLTKLKNMIGLKSIKTNIVGHIVYYLQNLETTSDDMMHTVIQGPPGVGKTMLGKILGDIYYNLDILKPKNTIKASIRRKLSKNKFTFKVVKRSDLIGKYLGHTAVKTQKVIDQASGGVLFIDEAYSLGNKEGRDSFSKECIDTLNQNLTEKKDFLCIIAGYKDALQQCFFSYNEGLNRRFPFRYTIEPYTYQQLREIFIKMVNDIGWIAKDENIPMSFFKDHYKDFKNYAGDMETLLFTCKIEHGKRVFCFPKKRKILTETDIKNGFKVFAENRGLKKEEENESWKFMYV